MADTPEDDELLLDQEQDEGGNADEQGQEGQEQGSEKPGDLGDEELEIAFGDEAAPASGERETGLVKHLRDELRRVQRERDEARSTQRPSQPTEVGPKPTLEGCEYDTDKFDAEYEAWQARRVEAQKAETTVQQQDRAVQEAFAADVRKFEARRAELKVPGAEEAIETALASLNQVSAAVIVKAAENPALVLAALGQHPGKLAEIASIQDPLKQAVAVAKLEGTLKVAPRRKAPEPEQVESGSAPIPKGADKIAERLEKEAARTRDYSKYYAHLREQRKSKAK